MVIDASVLLNAFFPDEQQLEAQSLIRDYVAGVVVLSAPIQKPIPARGVRQINRYWRDE